MAAPGGAAAASLQQYAIPGGATAAALVYGPDGALWFTEPAADRIGRATTGGMFSDYALAPGRHPVGIALGPDGALWFTEAAGSRIGRITTAGVIAEFPVTPGSQPVGIATGPDGALWFTELAGDRVGRIAVDGTVGEYALPTPGAHPVAITAGPGGALWFTESGAGRIGLIDPATHAVAELPGYPGRRLGPGSDPEGITAGPDGAVWFTEQAANVIGRVSATGAVTEFQAAPGPFGITLGAEGALWFTQAGMALPGEPSAPGGIGRLATSGVLDLFPLAPEIGESPNDITTGPDGAIWIADGATIARVGGDLSATVPVISHLSMTHRSFRVPAGPRRTRTSIGFGLSAPAAVTLTILRREPGRLLGPGDCRPPRPALVHLPRCTATVTLVVQPRQAAAGRVSIGFNGFGENGRPLPPGRYQAGVFALGIRVTARPRAKSIAFTILR
ncbi:MAG: virginiamycin lyase [Solirubrobacteraceae bacterium]|nr:virginiamycin lyase [Solirubrobacteraceae bacterium]